MTRQQPTDAHVASRGDARLQRLQDIIAQMAGLVVAYSGGVDSTLLLRVAKQVLGDRVIAVTATSLTYPEREHSEAQQRAKDLGVRHVSVVSEELDIPGFRENPPERCYYCKSELFSKLRQIASSVGFEAVADGSNLDDTGDFRPGLKAAEEAGVRSPLKEAGLTKQDVRELSRMLGLTTWDKPSLACLASRFPYGDPIDAEGLRMVAEAEEFLRTLGFEQLRVRHHGRMARIEVPEESIGRALQEEPRRRIVSKLKAIGYAYVTMDLEGYRSGSMNEVLGKEG